MSTPLLSFTAKRFPIFALALYGSVSGVRADDYVGHPVTGAAIVTNGRFTNIYVYPNSDTETWEQHWAKVPSSLVPSGDYSRAHIDQFMSDLVSGWPGYFDPLMQYRTIDGVGISPPGFSGGIVASKTCVDAALRDVDQGVVQWGTLRSLANCHPDGQDPSPQVNLIISPDIKVAAPNAGPDRSPDMCTTSTTAYHAWGLGVPNFSVTPTNVNCNATFDNFTQSLTHEMVEILSSPAGFGYQNGTFGGLAGDGEIGDICEAKSGAKKNPSGSAAIAFTKYKSYGVARYWSNFDNACMPQMEGPPGTDTLVWQLNTSPPPRLTGQVRDYSTTVPAERQIPHERVEQLRIAIQTGNDDLRGGGGNDANVTVHFGNRDVISTNINGSRHWNNGETHIVTLKLPGGSVRVGDITGITLHKDYDGGFLDCCGDNWNVSQIALLVSHFSSPAITSVSPAAAGCGSGATVLTISGSAFDGAISVTARPLNPVLPAVPLGITTLASNSISATVPAGLSAGIYEIVVATPRGNSVQPAASAGTDLFSVGPVITGIAPRNGPIPGLTRVTVTGTCFDSPGLNPNLVAVYFGSLKASKGFNQCASSTECVVYSPPASTAGNVNVTVSVGGAKSPPTRAAVFTYSGPFISSIVPDHGPKTGGTDITINGGGFPPYLGAGNNMTMAFGSAKTSALCLGSSVSATDSCSAQTPPVPSAGPANVVATAFGAVSAPATFTYDEFPEITKFQNGIVTLNGNAPATGAPVSVTSSDPSVIRPEQPIVVVPSGSSAASAHLITLPSSQGAQVTVTANYRGTSASDTITVPASPPISMTVPATLSLNQQGTAQISINTPAPDGGATVLLSSDNPAAVLLPATNSVLIPAAGYTAIFPITGQYAGAVAKTVVLTASYQGDSVSAAVQVARTLQPCGPKKCPKGFHWDLDQCSCQPGVPR